MRINKGSELWTRAGGEANEKKEDKALKGQGDERVVPAKWMSEDEEQILDWILNELIGLKD